MARATLTDAREVTPAIITVMDPRAVLVFGGVIRSGEGNDLDLQDALATALRPFQKHIAIDPFVIPANTFRDYFLRGSPFLRAVVREGRRLCMKNAVSEWMKDARDELKAAEYLHAGGFWKLACFHAQQAIDHSIPSTLEAEDIQFMASIYRGRYPGEAGLLPLGEPTRDDAERAIETARKAL